MFFDGAGVAGVVRSFERADEARAFPVESTGTRRTRKVGGAKAKNVATFPVKSTGTRKSAEGGYKGEECGRLPGKKRRDAESAEGDLGERQSAAREPSVLSPVAPLCVLGVKFRSSWKWWTDSG